MHLDRKPAVRRCHEHPSPDAQCLPHERLLPLEHQQPLLFGKQRDKGIAFDASFHPRIVSGSELGRAFVWDETADTPAPAMALATMSEAEFPVPIGVFRRCAKATFEHGVRAQVAAAQQKKQQSLHDLLHSGEIWTVQ